jgi:hypothetical protein
MPGAGDVSEHAWNKKVHCYTALRGAKSNTALPTLLVLCSSGGLNVQKSIRVQGPGHGGTISILRLQRHSSSQVLTRGWHAICPLREPVALIVTTSGTREQYSANDGKHTRAVMVPSCEPCCLFPSQRDSQPYTRRAMLQIAFVYAVYSLNTGWQHRILQACRSLDNSNLGSASSLVLRLEAFHYVATESRLGSRGSHGVPEGVGQCEAIPE